jgi:hypothetical protein
MSDQEIADPLREVRSSTRDGMLACQRLLQRSPLGGREADEHAVLSGVRDRRPAELGHGREIS